MDKLKNISSYIASVIMLLAGATLYGFQYYYIKWVTLPYGIFSLLLVIEAFALTCLALVAKEDKKSKLIIKSAVSAAVMYAVSIFGAPFIVNNVLNDGKANVESAIVAMNLCFMQFVILLYMSVRKNGRYAKKLVLAAVSSFCVLALIYGISADIYYLPKYYKTYNKREAAPVGLGVYTDKDPVKADNADFYISPDGNDDNDGSFEHPFLTFEKARDAVRSLDKTGLDGVTVAVMAGEYRTSCIEFMPEDSGTETCPVTYCAYGDGEVILNGGVALSPADFSPVTDEAVLSRLKDGVKDNIVFTDLKALGLTADDWGKLYAIGSYNTAGKYTGDYTGDIYCELFVNDKRQNIARYPDSGFLSSGAVVEIGQGRETDGSLTENPDYDTLVDPKGDTYAVDKELADRISGWAELDKVWIFGYPKYDWADASTLIEKFDKDALTLQTKFVSGYGVKEGAPYYFYNVLEELDCEGEWYLDRENGMLYMYAGEDFETSVIDLSVTVKNILKAEADNLVFSGFTFKGTRSDAINITGNNNTVKNCLIKNVSGNAVVITGSDNLVTENEITRTGRGGIILTGGDRETLTPGNNIADNNLIHDWAEIYETYQPAVSLYGVGNVCSHNEMYNSTHEAVTYGGNDHVIEYNNIHDVCLTTDDGGAIYSGRRWDCYGTVIRYNCVYDLGSGEHRPDGIYMDDALSGQTIYGNILVNVPKIGIHLGGGRDMTVKNNIIINTYENSISYDQRAIDGVFGGWFNHSSRKDGDMWQNLYDSPWQTDIWKEAYPQMAAISDDFDNIDDPMFAPNPANSKVTGNVIVTLSGKIGNISDKAMLYSDISGNAIYKLGKLGKIFVDPANGDYTLSESSPVYDVIPGFEKIDMSQIGRY